MYNLVNKVWKIVGSLIKSIKNTIADLDCSRLFYLIQFREILPGYGKKIYDLTIYDINCQFSAAVRRYQSI